MSLVFIGRWDSQGVLGRVESESPWKLLALCVCDQDSGRHYVSSEYSIYRSPWQRTHTATYAPKQMATVSSDWTRGAWFCLWTC
jgi:hypothetical protein